MWSCYTDLALHWYMANLTISVDDATLKRMARVLALAEASASGTGRDGRTWTRDEVHRG